MAVIGITAKLEYEEGSTWVEVEKCKSVMFPNLNVSSVDTSNLGNTDFAMTFIPGMIDGGEVGFEAEYSEATYTALHALLREVVGWRVTAPSGEDAIMTCDGFLTKCDVTIAANDEVMISASIKMTGLPALST